MRWLILLALGLTCSCSSDGDGKPREPDQGMIDGGAADGAPSDVSTSEDTTLPEDLPATGGDSAIAVDTGGGLGSGWHDLAPIAGGERQETAVVALDGLVWVLGGFNRNGQIVPYVETYNPQTDSWSRKADFPVPAHHMNATVVDGIIWITGFLAGGFAADGRSFTYDPAADTWEPAVDLPAGRDRGASATGVIDGKIYVAGGVAGGAVSDFDVLDPRTGIWTELPDLPRNVDHAGFGVIDGKLVVASGRAGAITSFTEQVDIFDPAVGQWEQGAPIPTPRGGVASAVLGGQLYVFGGEGNRAEASGVFPQVEAYDLVADTWIELDPMPIPRHGLGAVALDGVIYLPGGAPEEFLRATDVHQAFVP